MEHRCNRGRERALVLLVAGRLQSGAVFRIPCTQYVHYFFLPVAPDAALRAAQRFFIISLSFFLPAGVMPPLAFFFAEVCLTTAVE